MKDEPTQKGTWYPPQPSGVCPNAPNPCNCTGACRREPVKPWPGGGFIGTPTMADIARLEKRIAELEQWIKGYEAGRWSNDTEG